MTTRWRTLEAYLSTLSGRDFTSTDVAAALGISGHEASLLVRAHLAAQKANLTLYALHRTGRTSASVWHVGDRVVDARSLGHQFFDDLQYRVTESLVPDLVRMGVSNPRAKKVADAIAAAVVGSVGLLAATL